MTKANKRTKDARSNLSTRQGPGRNRVLKRGIVPTEEQWLLNVSLKPPLKNNNLADRTRPMNTERKNLNIQPNQGN